MNLSELYKKEASPTPPAELTSAILFRISREATRDARRQKVIGASFGALSLATFLIALTSTLRSFGQSAFSEFFSLVFSDIGSLSVLWKELVLSLIESLPVIGIALVSVSIALFLWSTQKLFGKKFVRGIIRTA